MWRPGQQELKQEEAARREPNLPRKPQGHKQRTTAQTSAFLSRAGRGLCLWITLDRGWPPKDRIITPLLRERLHRRAIYASFSVAARASWRHIGHCTTVQVRVCDDDSAASSAKHSPQNSSVQSRRTTSAVSLSSSRHTGHSLRSVSDFAAGRARFFGGSNTTASPLVSWARSARRRFAPSLNSGAHDATKAPSRGRTVRSPGLWLRRSPPAYSTVQRLQTLVTTTPRVARAFVRHTRNPTSIPRRKETWFLQWYAGTFSSGLGGARDATKRPSRDSTVRSGAWWLRRSPPAYSTVQELWSLVTTTPRVASSFVRHTRAPTPMPR